MSRQLLKRDHSAHIILNGQMIDLVTVREIEWNGQRITTQSEQCKPGVMEEFVYLSEGEYDWDGTKIQVTRAGWRLLFWVEGKPNKCMNPDGGVYEIRPAVNTPAVSLHVQ